MEELAAQGPNYYWTWGLQPYCHDHLNEGVRFCVKSLKADEILVSNMDGTTILVEWPMPIRVWMAKTLLLPASIFLGGDKGFQFEGLH